MTRYLSAMWWGGVLIGAGLAVWVRAAERLELLEPVIPCACGAPAHQRCAA